MSKTSAPRTPAQALASRANGSKSRGPRTAQGLLTSSANSLQSGLYARALLGPGLDVETVQAAFDGWLKASGARAPVAHQLAARGAVATVQMDRVEAIRERILSEVLEERVKQSEASKALDYAREVRDAVAGLAVLASGIGVPVPRPEAAKLLPALRAVVHGVLELPVAAGAGFPLAASIALIEGDGIDDIPVDVFEAVARNASEILSAIDAAIPEMEGEFAAERARQEELLVLANDKRLREIDRVRSRLIKEVESVARALSALKELEVKAACGEPAHVATLPPVEFRLVSGPRRR